MTPTNGMNPFNAQVNPQAPQQAPIPTVPPTAAPTSVPPTTAPTATAAPVEGEKKRRQPNRQMSVDERKFVIENYAQMSTNELAEKLKLTKQQVYRTVNETRKNLQKRLASLNESPDSPEKTASMAKIQEILDKLPNKQPFGPGGSGARRKSAIDASIDDLLNGLV